MKIRSLPTSLCIAFALVSSLSGCAGLALFSYMEKGFYSDHGKNPKSPVHNTNESCSVHGTCGGVRSCELYGNCTD